MAWNQETKKMSEKEIESLIQSIEALDLKSVGFSFLSRSARSAGFKNFINLVNFRSPFLKMKLIIQFCAYVNNEGDAIETANRFSLMTFLEKETGGKMNLDLYCSDHALPLAKLNEGKPSGTAEDLAIYLEELDQASRTYLFDFFSGKRFEPTPDPRDL